jgi:peptide/nickel transport system ATP-binding protein
MTPLLAIRDLTIRFGEANAPASVHKINLDIERGTFQALVGESGSGKSITALSILQLLPKSTKISIEGKILFHSDAQSFTDLMDLPNDSMNEIRGKKIGMVFQEPMTALNPLIRVGDQITEVLRTHKGLGKQKARQEAIQWMKQVKLPDPEQLFNRFPHQLSGGQKQRILIASAICCQPDLLICDEPTTALDVTVQREILDLIRSIQKQNKMSVLFISHDLALVSEYADRVAVLFKGELVEQGNNPTLFQSPTHPYTRALIACRPAAHKKGTRLPVISDFLEPASKKETPLQVPAAISRSTESFLKVESVSIGYPMNRNRLWEKKKLNTIVHSVSFDIYKSEMLGLVGESGSGKSSLGRALLGLIRPASGSIWHEGIDLLKIPVNQWPLKRHQLQLVFQDPYSSLNPRMTIGDIIGEPLRKHRIVQNRADEKAAVLQWLERVQLSRSHYDRYPHEFSGGQRQRIVIARALALQPDFVVCDESVSALDVSIQAQVLNLLNDLRQELNFTCLFISHDLGVVRYLCDRILVLQQGRLVESGETEAVCTHPKDPYTRDLLRSIPQLQSVV